jgi:hypothetical protein
VTAGGPGVIDEWDVYIGRNSGLHGVERRVVSAPFLGRLALGFLARSHFNLGIRASQARENLTERVAGADVPERRHRGPVRAGQTDEFVRRLADEPMYFHGARLLRVTGLGPLIGRLNLFHVVKSYNGIFSIGATADRNALPDPATYAQCMQTAFPELLAAAG